MPLTPLRAAALSISQQVAATLGNLGHHQPHEQLYVFALVVSDDFATVCQAANSESHFARSSGGAVARWQPAEWFATGMELDVTPLMDRLGDPTYQRDPALARERPAKQAAWLAALVEGLEIARNKGHLTWGDQPLATFCTVQDSDLGPWLARTSARLLNPPDLFPLIEAELAEAWAGWDPPGDESAQVQEAFNALRADPH
ncbi:MAG: DUF4303 domain-containing protein [Gemmataceae bacterium]